MTVEVVLTWALLQWQCPLLIDQPCHWQAVLDCPECCDPEGKLIGQPGAGRYKCAPHFHFEEKK